MSSPTPLDRYRWMARMREFDLACLEGVPTGEIHGELHTGIGQEAIAAGMAGSLRQDDALVSTHRNHSHALAKGVDPRALMAEIYERTTGLCGGYGGHMHPFDPARNFSATGIVGASLPVALGYAYAIAAEGRDAIAVAVTGDAGSNHGTFHECMNIAAAWELPLVVVVENNRYGISVSSEDVIPTATIAERAAAYDCIGETVDGTDAEAVAETFGRLVAETRAASAPCVFEATCFRFQGHYEGDPQIYRTRAEHEQIRRDGDPLLVARARLTAAAVATGDELDAIDTAAREEMQELLRSVREDPMPDPTTALEHVFA
ncbi:thiamine pyrophosphate-dependent dehydrogenase E1 component subunit alpha [Conexibacter woesei]|uniref:Dehydrogenase E1 component n=1 Tax=Conexibacter woesei (strain DSM 14684 / CCUG 47730 / CIP 108061 / JCM 11494 / NBRC 100937 / ID131577) TaxID=469383 RepID=D3FAM8_CONWI|nr:thiamine pyrophosphate-dependent dehydrogenase E1 component subunit alpha [Conexibacter woesei]ADB51191.1 dehydrogenase E1 component [Conexibacter woesei DSM 14684]